MIIIGNGMLAKAFEASGAARENLVLFCSGVSNSRETLDGPFNREKSLLLEVVNRYPGKKIVYFSSCSADDIETPYYQHKRVMESLVKSVADRHLIARLPQVVGITKNTTLVSYIVRCVSVGAPITVFEGARRNLIDVNDVVRLTLFLASLDINHINISNGNAVLVEEIIAIICRRIGVEPVVLTAPPETGGGFYDGKDLKKYLTPNDPIYSETYNHNLLAKYAPMLIE